MWQPIDPVRRHESEAAKGHLEGGDHARPRRSPGPKWSEAFWPLLRRKELSKGVADHLVRAPPGESRLAVWRPGTPKPKPSERPFKSRCGRLLPVNTPGPRDAWTVSSRQWSCPSKLESGTGKLAMRVAYLSAYWAGPQTRERTCATAPRDTPSARGSLTNTSSDPSPGERTDRDRYCRQRRSPLPCRYLRAPKAPPQLHTPTRLP